MVRSKSDPLLPGTLDLLILQILDQQSLHGYGIAQRIQLLSREVLRVGEGSLYPALQRMSARGWLEAEWQLSETRRRARYYRLTSEGKRALKRARADYRRMAEAIARVERVVDEGEAEIQSSRHGHLDRRQVERDVTRRGDEDPIQPDRNGVE